MESLVEQTASFKGIEGTARLTLPVKSIKPSVFSQIKLVILQAPEGEGSRTYTSTWEDSDIDYVNQIPNREYVNEIPSPEYVNAWVDC